MTTFAGALVVRTPVEDADHLAYALLLQSYDFFHLRRAHDCDVQLGGSDQWGNITAGIELIRRVDGKEGFGLRMPLVTTASGSKFGKSEKGNVWLDAERTSPYELYQFFLNTDDRDVGKFLRFYTELDEPAIAALDESLRAQPEKREAHRALARQVTKLVHGEAEAERPRRPPARCSNAKAERPRRPTRRRAICPRPS